MEKRRQVFLARIEERLAVLELTAARASARAGYGTTLIRDLKAGRNQFRSLIMIDALAKTLQCDPGWLVGWNDLQR
jgi:hypothetical protein